MKRILTVLGARPQFIKAKPLNDLFKLHKGYKEVVVHTGQHYDFEMSEVFFRELKLTRPTYYLNVGGYSNLEQVSLIAKRLKSVMEKEKPHLVVVYGDTNSTLAGALSSKMLKFPLVHIEAGLRSYNLHMPEEINRIVTDRLSDLLFAPVQEAVENLKKEGIVKGVYLTGDVLYDVLLDNAESLEEVFKKIARKITLKPFEFTFFTLHRAENVDNRKNLELIISTLSQLKGKIVFPIHPRVRKRIKEFGLMRYLKENKNIVCIEPQSYLASLAMVKYSYKVITDSGGIQREAYMLQRPCIILRNQTEWTQILKVKGNYLLPINPSSLRHLSILHEKNVKVSTYPKIFGDGKAAQKIFGIIKQFLQ